MDHASERFNEMGGVSMVKVPNRVLKIKLPKLIYWRWKGEHPIMGYGVMNGFEIKRPSMSWLWERSSENSILASPLMAACIIRESQKE